MILTKKQEEGLKIAIQRFKDGERWTCIAGYAGTGKSTLIKFIISELGVNQEREVCYVAYTGKAANVLQAKGCPNATTAHKLLYKAVPMPDGSFIFEEKYLGDSGLKVIVVDEVSMLPKQMWDLLISHGIYILATGDPGQLPPVDKTSDNGILNNPHVFLDEIMRQAQDSEIIRLSMWIREGKPINLFPCSNQQVMIVKPRDVVTGMYEWADQIICSTNAKRVEINNLVRTLKGFGELPQIGDKIISLRNHWDYWSSTGNWALTNGSIGTIEKFNLEEVWVPRYIKTGGPITYMMTDIRLEDGDAFYNTPIDYQALSIGIPQLDSTQIYKMSRNKYVKREAPYDFTYAYGMTAHKSQGSEWPKVLVFEENFPFNKEEHIRSLYTEATRASEKLVVVTKD